ncbi:hypothetical protein AURDEDRAFT_111020 [Auricularia subglabra TFB-10046 SS5]|nr:hypothetical protein AURDEDRAFT_111020 [Auricularia subglabra TFB-10046 SS5]
MPQSFTPKDIIEPGKEREWASALGGLDWDKTAIVFTKRTFVEFLRYAGTTVDPNWGNVSKLPRYAQFGTLRNEDGSIVDFTAAAAPKETTSDFAPPGTSDFKPSRRVTSPPGGKESISIFSEQAQEEYVPPPPRAPRKLAAMQETPLEEEVTEQVAGLSVQKQQQQQQPPAEEEQPAEPPKKAPEPDTSIWGSSSDQPSSFRPTRRVREGPGGHDSLAGLI